MKLPIIRLIWLLSAAASAATHAVLPGEAIQPKIDAAAPGDIIAIFGGTYPGDVTINKAVRLVEVDGQDVTITGNVTWNGVTDAPPFEGFTVGSAGKKITITSGTKVLLKGIDTRAGDRILMQGATTSVDILSSHISGVNQEGGVLVMQETILSQAISSNTSCKKTILNRCRVLAQSNVFGAEKVYIAYSELGTLTYSGINGIFRAVASKFDGQGSVADNLFISGSGCDIGINNCSFIGTQWAKWSGSVERFGRGINVAGGNSSRIFNNHVNFTIFESNPGYATIDFAGGDGIRVADSNSIIANNIIWGTPNYGIFAPYGAIVMNNCIHNVWRGQYRGGVIPEGTILANPGVVNSNALPLILQPTSPCLNAGFSDPRFNDLDGTRNDIGPGGGCLFDPQGWTTNKPILVSFDLAPQQLLKGVDTQVTISNGQAVAQP